MLLSMTGFGASEVESNSHLIKAEIRTLNSKYLDINLKLPRELTDWENDIRVLLGNIFKRGKVNLQLELETRESEGLPTVIDEELFERYLEKYRSLSEKVDEVPQDIFKLALHSPEVIKPKSDADIDVPWEEVARAIESAGNLCTEFRKTEGANIQENLENYIEGIGDRLEKIEGHDPLRAANIRERIERNIQDIRERTQVDQNRFEQELIYYLEKLDISEEKVRLSQHLKYFGEIMSEEDSQGKKLGFISQEIGREINTIGSKANDASIQRWVVEMKDELEKIKEQVLNIL